MAGTLSKLNDENRERVNHLVRRDEYSDLAIAQEAERLHGERLWKTDAARQRAVARYRDGKKYQGWLKEWKVRCHESEKRLAEQRQRFEVLRELVSTDDGDGASKVSRLLQARLLAIAAETSDEELVEQMGKAGWVRNLMRLIQMEERVRIARELADKAKAAEEIAGSTSLNAAERARRMREIFADKKS